MEEEGEEDVSDVDEDGQQLTAYELVRKRQIKRNNKYLENLGFVSKVKGSQRKVTKH